MAYLEVRNIFKSFGATKVLKGVNFDVNQGEVVSILGSSGSGKTTLLRCLNFLETADDGTIMLNGDYVFNAKSNIKVSRTNRLNFGMVFQQFNLFPQYNVLDNVTLAPKLNAKENVNEYKNSLKNQALPKDEISKLVKEYESKINVDIVENAKSLIKRVGLEDKINNYPCELSGGQQQRVAIARALAMKPNILCFDEPTSALDPELTGEVLKVIKELKYTTNCTMLIVTHEMDFARKVSDKIIFMANGVVEEEGKPEDVFNNPVSPITKAFLAKSEEKF